MFQFITHTAPGISYVESARLALAGGCRWIQLRMKEAAEAEIVETALEVKALCRKKKATFIVDDHVEIARYVGADGVHLGKTDMSPTDARRLLTPQQLIGGTANTFEDVERLAGERVDYIGLGPFRFTRTKARLSPILGLEGYASIVEQCRTCGIRIPIVAIGGITVDDIPAILQTGVSGIALSGAILTASDPVEETNKILNIIEKWKN